MNYSEANFDGCLFNPMVKEDMLKVYPQLNQIVEKSEYKGFESDAVIRYVCALYDKASPLILAEKDLKYRKQVAADIAGIVDETRRASLFEYTNRFAIDLTIRFLQRFMKDRVWAVIVSAEYTFWEYTRRLMDPIGEKSDALKEIEIQDAAHQRLNTYTKEFYGDDTGLQKAAQFIRTTAETVAKIKKY